MLVSFSESVALSPNLFSLKPPPQG
jgi:hypothetical protein